MAFLFEASFALVAPFWFLMLFVPAWRWSERIIASSWIAALAALLYLWLIVPGLVAGPLLLSPPTLATVAPLFATPEGVTIGWIHFLAFDLLVGRWIYLDARQRAVPAYLTTPILLFTLMLGPIGFLAYLAVRTWRRADAPALRSR
jgi:hypothetical protein